MNIQIFGTKKCNDTKKAERFFKERRIKFQFIDLKEKALSKGELQSVKKALSLESLINKNSKDYKKLNLDKIRGAETREEILLKNPSLYVTPIVRNGKEATVGYDIENLSDAGISYRGEIKADRYGRNVPKHAHGTTNLMEPTSSTKRITDAVMKLYDEIVNPKLLVRRINITANHLEEETKAKEAASFEQLDLFTDYDALTKEREEENAKLEKERKLQEAMLSVKKRYGKNAMLKGMNLLDGATTMERNRQIGGHKA